MLGHLPSSERVRLHCLREIGSFDEVVDVALRVAAQAPDGVRAILPCVDVAGKLITHVVPAAIRRCGRSQSLGQQRPSALRLKRRSAGHFECLGSCLSKAV